MSDSDLKTSLLETCPVLPGQEARAWALLQERLHTPVPALFSLARLGRPLATAFAVGVLLLGVGTFLSSSSRKLASADSQSPGIFATAFYSRNAQAQVVWLNGLEPASDRPTYLDPTTVVAGPDPEIQPSADPNRL